MKTEIGALYQGEGICRFVLWAPEADSVNINFVGEEPVSIPFIHESYGYWFTEVEGVYPGDQYYYSINSGPQLPDPASKSQPHGIYGPSAVVSHHDFSWTDEDWKNIPLKDMIIYELHTGTFTESGTFDGVASRIQYLKELGVNVIELMPIAEFPGNRNWGYDGVLPFAVHHAYGGPDGLKRLVNACHQAGIAVILDVVYNHLGPEGNILEKYGHYYTSEYKTPWGAAINFDGPHSDEVRNYFIQNALMWLRDYHIDALRLDAVHAYKDFSAYNIIAELTSVVKDLSLKTGKQYILIGECDLNNPTYIKPAEEGYGLDAQWCDEFHHALHAIATGERDGYYEDFGELEHLRRAFENSYVYTGHYSQKRKRSFGKIPEKHPYSQFVVFTQNHDQIGNRMLGERLSTLVSLELLKLMAGVLFLSPSVPLLFMGEEYAEENPFLYFTSHTRPSLIKAVKEGRKKEFCFSGNEEPADPQSPETFARSKLSWDQSGNRAIISSWYKKLIALRKTHEAFQHDQRNSLRVESDEENGLFSIVRLLEDGTAILFGKINFGKKDSLFVLPEPGT